MIAPGNDATAIRVEIVHALPDRQERMKITVPAGTTVADAIAQSSIDARFPESEITQLPTGIWGRPVGTDHVLADGDRVEIYRRLKTDPREERRKLAAHGKAMGQHDDEPSTSHAGDGNP